MGEAVALAENVNKLILALVSIVTILSGLGIFDRMNTRKSLRQIQKSVDEKQTASIDALILSYSNYKQEIEDHFNSLEERFELTTEFILEVKFFKDIRKEIKKTIRNVITCYNGKMDNTIKGLLTEGSDAAYEFFKDIYSMSDMDIRDIKDSAILKLRGLRSHSVGNQNISDEVIERIKNEAAIPSIDSLIFSIQQNKPETDDEFKAIVIGFIETIASKTVTVYLRDKKETENKRA